MRGDDLAGLDPAPGLPRPACSGSPSPPTRTSAWCSGPTAARLAKRHGAVTLRELEPAAALAWLAHSLGRPGAAGPRELLEGFDATSVPREAVRFAG